MDWKEMRVRLGQEFYKGRDLLKYQMGAANGAIRLKSNAATRPGQFFFSSCEAPERAQLLRHHLPNEASEILRDADEICGHRFRLLGYDNLDFAHDSGTTHGNRDKGVDIDWHLDPVHGKRAPLNPWFKIPFLDFDAVGDHKIIWELNRHQHLVTLAKARLLSGDEQYTRELMTQWRSWIDANPYPLGINWASSLEVAFRSLSWIWVDQLLASCRELGYEKKGQIPATADEVGEYAEFRAQLLPALAFHGRHIERYLSTYFSPNTHLLGEAVALFFLGTLYPQMPESARWKESGCRILLHEAERQVRPDGVYFEQSLYYHVYALDFFLHARALAARNKIEVPPAYDIVLTRMLDVITALSQAGPPEGFGDDDGGRVFNPRRNRTEHMTDPLALGAMTYSKDIPAAPLTEEAIWLFGDRAVEKLADTRKSAVAHSTAFSDGGLYVLADSQPHAQAMAVDAGPQGVGRSGHGHADALSLRLTMEGGRWLVDAGTGVYISKDPADRNTFRGTAAHNTMCVDGMDQAVADEPFSWTHIPTTQTENWVVGKSFTYFVGSHNGYARLADPVLHRRHVLKIAGDLWLVRDVALGQAEHELEIRWHFAPDLDVKAIGPGRMEVSRPNSGHNESNEPALSLIVPEETAWQTSMEVSGTLISPGYGAYQPTPMVRCHARVLLPAETATAVLPRSGTAQNKLSLASTAHEAVQVYELEGREGSHGFFFALGDKAWSFGPWSSDAQMLYCRIEKEKLTHLILIGGTQAAWQGRPLLSAARQSPFFEWRKPDAVTNPEFSVTALFSKLTGTELTGAELTGAGLTGKTISSFAEKH
jgi:hypothetical protein